MLKAALGLKDATPPSEGTARSFKDGDVLLELETKDGSTTLRLLLLAKEPCETQTGVLKGIACTLDCAKATAAIS